MLVGGTPTARRAFLYLLGTIFVFCIAAALWYLGVAIGLVTRAPGAALFGYTNGTTTIGYYAGVAGFAVIIFEMLFWPRKYLRGYRLGRARLWLKLHIWLGLAVLPLAIIHSGFAYGGLLTGVIMMLFYAVIASGVWGLGLQQIIPQKLLDDIPQETIATERGVVIRSLLSEARGMVDRLNVLEVDTASGGIIAPSVHYRSKQFSDFFRDQVVPYLEAPGTGPGVLASRSRSARLFDDIRSRAQEPLAGVAKRMEAICETRRQLDRQYNLYWWLHSWLCVHLPLSIALTGLLIVHVVYALKFW